MFEITITVDTNDGDYATEVSNITPEQLEKIRPLIEAIKEFKPYEVIYKTDYKIDGQDEWPMTHRHNYPCGDILRDDLGEKDPREIYKFPEEIFELFEDFIPYGEYGFHTIESISYCPLQEKIKLL